MEGGLSALHSASTTADILRLYGFLTVLSHHSCTRTTTTSDRIPSLPTWPRPGETLGTLHSPHLIPLQAHP